MLSNHEKPSMYNFKKIKPFTFSCPKYVDKNMLLERYYKLGVFGMKMSPFYFFCPFLSDKKYDTFDEIVRNNGILIDGSLLSEHFYRKDKLFQIVKFFSRFVQDYVYYSNFNNAKFIKTFYLFNHIKGFYDFYLPFLRKFIENYITISSYIFVNYERFFNDTSFDVFLPYNEKIDISALQNLIKENIEKNNGYFDNFLSTFKELYNNILDNIFLCLIPSINLTL